MAFRLSFSLLSLILLCLANTSESFREPKVQAFLHPIYKDKATKLYSLPLAVGTAFSRDFVIDFNGAAPLLLNCATAVKSTSYHSIRCDSTRCKFANPNTSCPKNITNNKPTCRKYVSTSLSARPVHARLLRDTLDLSYTPEGVFVMDTGKISTLTLTCTDDATALKPIPKAFGGYIGFGNNHLSIPSQLVPMYKLHPKMSLCLPSTEGMESYPGGLWIGGGPFYYLPYLKDVSKIFASTPLIGNNKGEYLIDVKSIEIGGKTIPILHGPTKICTLAPYTVLQSSIYKALVTAFVGSVKMAKAPTAKPFSACFHSDGGRGVPVIDLVMSGGAKWMIHGSNSLVKVSKDVVCLGFVDGGVNPKNPILIGGFQMEDNLVQFDLKASKFSFSSSLLLHNTSCSIARLFGM